MRLKPEQLPSALKKELALVYILSGDEPLQLGEGADQVRAVANQAGFTSREVFFAETAFNWATFLQSAESLPLFSERRVLDLRLLSNGPGREGEKALLRYAQWSPEDTLLLVSMGKLSASTQKSAWFKALEQAGVVVQVWPLEGARLVQWLARRLSQKGLTTDHEGLLTLAARVEGNLLAAAQEIDKLFMLYGAGKITADTVDACVASSARFDVFKLADSVLQGDAKRIKRIISGLRQEGVAPPVVLWALTKEIRLSEQILFQLNRGVPMDEAIRQCRVWDQRKPLLMHALKRLSLPQLMNAFRLSARADRLIKGVEKGDEWMALMDVCFSLLPRRVETKFN